MANDKHFSTEFPFYGEVSFDYDHMTTDYDGVEHYLDDRGMEVASVIGEALDSDRSVTLYEYTSDGLCIRETEYAESKGEDGFVALKGDSWEKFGDQNGTFYLHTEVSESRTQDGDVISSYRYDTIYGDSPYHEDIRELDSLSDDEGWMADNDKIYEVINSDIETTTEGDFAKEVAEHNFDARVADALREYEEPTSDFEKAAAEFNGTGFSYEKDDEGNIKEKEFHTNDYYESVSFDKEGRPESMYISIERDDTDTTFDSDSQFEHTSISYVDHFDYDTKTISREMLSYEHSRQDWDDNTETIVYDRETDTYDYELRNIDGELVESYKCDINGDKVDVCIETDADKTPDKEQNPDYETNSDAPNEKDNDPLNTDNQEEKPDNEYNEDGQDDSTDDSSDDDNF